MPDNPNLWTVVQVDPEHTSREVGEPSTWVELDAPTRGVRPGAYRARRGGREVYLLREVVDPPAENTHFWYCARISSEPPLVVLEEYGPRVNLDDFLEEREPGAYLLTRGSTRLCAYWRAPS